MNRRDFFKSAKPKIAAQPRNVRGIKRVQSGLMPYTGVWTINEVTHLLKRTMFGAKKADIDHFLTMNANDAVDELLNNTSVVSPPLRDYGLVTIEEGTFDDAGVPQGQTWINDLNKMSNVDAAKVINNLRVDSLRKWWVGIMIHQNASIWEKMVLFWHHHFSIQKEEVEDANMIYRHHDLLRKNAFGNVRQLTKDVSKDPAMLIHLNGYLNSKVAPDENYARELQELFTVGKGIDSLYSEDDVIAAARVLTGWRVADDTKTSFADPSGHDSGSKSFSSFYNNTTISGSDAATELDQLINMIYATPESAKYFCRKLYRWFVYSDIDDDTEANVIQPLADILRNNNFEVKPVLNALFKSAHFFDAANMACHIKNPFDFIVGTLREFDAVFPAYTDYVNGYPLFDKIYQGAAMMQQDLLQPPDVSGWPAYHQEPMFYELWVNSNSLPRRADFTNGLIIDKVINVKGFSQYSSDPSDPDQLINDVTDMLLRYPLTANSKLYIKNNFLINNSGDNNVWTNAWNSNDPSVGTSLEKMFLFVTNLPEFHLC
jgi:uncharacterized protein (DUF1800 family)